ncbi:sugar transferase [Olleya sp. Bg11-27]|uniref:sugar transferase n=1 Tax=Olleya sp. Bg11-27 TaxID=2058135 RepID=UPI000C30D87A|nr:sugar transferase [Olleya sp. Bg11-27]AUC74753.1 sugar transferase [Olleya sp. Bg11-27]
MRPYKYFKRFNDFLFAIILLVLFSWFILILIIIASLDTRSLGIFTQSRIGYLKKPFIIYKIKTFQDNHTISKIGAFLRQYKLDESPQLFNVLIGHMSFVGPRPDISGFADTLKSEESIILTVKPGVTGPATLYFRKEEKLLAKQNNPEDYNTSVIWPKKVELNIKYVKELSFKKDIYYLVKTFL